MKIDVKYNKPSVYVIRNIINGKRYVGSTSNLYKRIGLHKSYLLNDKHDNINLLEDFRFFNDIDVYEIKYKIFEENCDVDFLRKFEEKYIRIFKPEFNISLYPTAKNGKPNLGKKFNNEWKSKLGKCLKHSEETLDKLTKINKEGACKLKFANKHSTLEFTSWVEAGKFFGVNYRTILRSFSDNGKYKDYTVTKLNNQKKKVKVIKNNECFIFDSSSEGDKFLNKWRGCVSNAIKNNKGFIGDIYVEYVN